MSTASGTFTSRDLESAVSGDDFHISSGDDFHISIMLTVRSYSETELSVYMHVRIELWIKCCSNQSQLSCKDLIEPKFYFASEENIKEGKRNE